MTPTPSRERPPAPRPGAPAPSTTPRLEEILRPSKLESPPSSRPASPPFSAPVFAVAAAAGLAGHFVAGFGGVVVALLLAACGGVAAALLGGGRPEATPPTSSDSTREAARERERADHLKSELERARRHVEMATTHLRDGKDPLTEVPELRVGPIRELLQAAKEGTALPVVSRLAMTEQELVDADGEPLPVPWPKDAAPEATFPEDSEARAEAAHELDALIEGLEALRDAVAAPAAGTASGGGRTPAQLLDAVVHTAADGIEDLAAGLMRANELAGVAERVTNKATLLALNAALEATRSGSESFAAIAEETRRLAEFAREATDTIARLSNEIEYKVGETITAIHATSEDAKSAVATFAAAPGGGAAPPPFGVADVEALLRRAREIERRLGA